MTGTADLPDLLSKVELFSQLSNKHRKAIAKMMRVVEVPKGHQVVEEGHGSVGFHLILEGTADVTSGGEHRNSLGPGDHFGEVSLIDGLPRSATVTATSPVRTASITAWDFTPFLEESPELALGLLKGMCARLRAAESFHA